MVEKDEEAERGLRRRRQSTPTSPDVSTPPNVSPEAKALSNPPPTLSWRFVVRWVARFLLVILLLLSTAKIVRVPGRSRQDESSDLREGTTLLLVITHSRAEYLKRCLESVLKHHGNAAAKRRWPLVVSVDRQDGEMHDDVLDVISDAQDGAPRDMQFVTWLHDASYPPHGGEEGEGNDPVFVDQIAYRRISKHYYWALHRAFSVSGIERVVVLEDDLEVAPDFFNFFDALTPMLESDSTLLCVSAWNDNGKGHLDFDPSQLHRTDFFPGLGWMLTRNLWTELQPKWPDIFWDDWIRARDQTKGRHCIRPEVSRTANFGANGVSQSFQHDKHVAKVVLNTEPVNFASLDLRYLEPEKYKELVFRRISDAVLLTYSNYLTTKPQDGDVIVRYPEGNMSLIGKRMGIMTDHRDGVFRTSYMGVVIVPWNRKWAFIVARDWVLPEGYVLGSKTCCGKQKLSRKIAS